MTISRSPLAIAAFLLAVPGLLISSGGDVQATLAYSTPVILFVAAAVALFTSVSIPSLIVVLILVHVVAFCLIDLLGSMLTARPDIGYWCMVASSWLLAWFSVQNLAGLKLASAQAQRLVNFALPVLFGAWLLILWEILVRGFGVPSILLPPPSMIAGRIANSVPTLWVDFQQTYLKAAIAGYAIGCGSGFLAAIIVDRVPFLRRGLLPIGNLVAALPVVGIAPIMVMWFGSYWESKAAVVVIMTFFPMLVNTVAGLAASGAMERDLMQTYGSSYGQTLLKLRLPAAMPFIFNALKINSTLALIGAIVAEFFGSPIVGMGFRISAEVGRMNVDMVWAEIFVAALAGSLSYGLITLIERAVTFWHPSYRT
ncbi:ABC transporter permease [Phyllobacterium myrsinacearum]|uniref:NitT/TauT family transport system permease protein n=1 Tax=Phyllobacterium myrsinacearum TaxID=28101 RepID=A0A839ELY4_9HYPH|nr:ABC transporter permease [Phyllobacterium myrsinacearum]MBA8877700.1 NitT/TauT family transport system permease protein [Phyllobacterium myrsinacearum]